MKRISIQRLMPASLVVAMSWGRATMRAVASILVLAPHPDDDVLIAAGVTLAATSRGESVLIVYMTNGDTSPSPGVETGLLRQNEAVKAQTNHLGTTENDLIFLGYPDGALQELMRICTNESDVYTNQIGQAYTYGVRGLGGADYHTVRFGFPAAYNRSNLLRDLEDILDVWRPDHIFTLHEADIHPDHQATSEALRLAIEALQGREPSYRPIVHSTIVWTDYAGQWPAPSDPMAPHVEPPDLASAGLIWAERESLDVPVAMQVGLRLYNPKYAAIRDHESQFSDFLERFVHQDEFFWVHRPGETNQPPRAEAGPSLIVNGGGVFVLDGTASLGPDGTNGLAFSWSQIHGPPLPLDVSNSPTPRGCAPVLTSNAVILGYQLCVNDSSLTSAADRVTVTVYPPLIGSNVAPSAFVEASSENVGNDQVAAKAVDGVADGWPGDWTREWATLGEGTGAWLRLTWSATQYVGRVVLHDRPNRNDEVLAGELRFSDGTYVPVGPLPNNGRGLTVVFAPRRTISLTFLVTDVTPETSNVGLSEIEVDGREWTPPPRGLLFTIASEPLGRERE